MKPNNRHSLRDGLTAYGALSSVSMTLLVTVACGLSLAGLTPAQGCQDHTPSPHALMPFV
jgi:hypothetical protein